MLTDKKDKKKTFIKHLGEPFNTKALGASLQKIPSSLLSVKMPCDVKEKAAKCVKHSFLDHYMCKIRYCYFHHRFPLPTGATALEQVPRSVTMLGTVGVVCTN